MSKKSSLADLLFRRLKYVSVPICSALRPELFNVLAYHRVSPPQGADYPFLDGIVSATPEDFEEQLRFVKKRFNVINFDIVSDIMLSGRGLPENPLVITFDDGYADNYEIAFNLLKKYGLTATVFVSTSFVDSGQPLWFDKSAYVINKIPEGPLAFDSANYNFDVNDSNRKQTIKAVRDLFLSVSNDERVRFMDELAQQSGIGIEQEHLDLVRPLNWDQIKEMSDNGIEIGSHTVTHPYLTNLTRDQLEYELGESKRVIEQHTGRSVKSIAYPAGVYDKEVVDCAKRCGYQFGISYDHGIKRLNEDDLFAIPRIHVETDVSVPLFKANLLFPQLFVR
jgi:peptidoglycan/xylan/chitin deacetylase (PgdA/CDA1 family)